MTLEIYKPMELFTLAHEQLSQNHNEQVIAELGANFEAQPAKLLLIDYDETTVVHGFISPSQLALLYGYASQFGLLPHEVDHLGKVCKWGNNISGYNLADESVPDLLCKLITAGIQLVGLTNQPLPSAANTGNFIAIASGIPAFPTLSGFYEQKHLLAERLLRTLPDGSQAVFYDDQVANVNNMNNVAGVSAFTTEFSWRELATHCLSLWQES